MEFITAKTAGFCFGVNNAVKSALRLSENKEGMIYSYGPIIHNKNVVNYLENKGVRVIENIDDKVIPGKVIIRAHGVGPEVYEKLVEKGFQIEDATCVYVKKIHTLVKEKYENGYSIIIIGDKNHPEIIGVNGWCNNNGYIISSEDEITSLEVRGKCAVVAQTTIPFEKWDRITSILKEKYSEIETHNTICSATSNRQKEALEIASKVDMMVVIGDKNSSNTNKLYELCSKECKNSFMIENANEIPYVDTKKIKKIGITAGASTPEWIIKEVLEKMSEQFEKEMSMHDVYENSFITLESGTVCKGTVIRVTNSEIYVDLGYKSDGIIPADEYSDDPDFQPKRDVKVGEEVEAFIVRVNDGEGYVLLSKKKVDAVKGWDYVEEAFNNKSIVTAKVAEVVNKGVVAIYKGVKIFIPGSQLSHKYVEDLSSYLKKEIRFRIIEINKNKKRAVGSAKVVLEEEKLKQEAEVWDNIEIGKKYVGKVKSITDFGAFVDIGGVDGLVHISELSWTKVAHPSQVLKEGDNIEVYIKELDRDKKRISLGYRKHEDNPWEIAKNKYNVGDIVKGKVLRMTPFGVFLEIMQGVDGLVHISQISNYRLGKPDEVLSVGQEVEAKIIEIKWDEKKISLSIKEVNPIDPERASKVSKIKLSEKDEKNSRNDLKSKNEQTQEELVPSEHKEELGVTIGDVLVGLNDVQQNKNK